ncbi:MAG: NADH-quinone oxidoreductase subunit H, partial [Campylobacterales bacterium]
MIAWLLVALAPVLGGLLYGVERKLKARMQRRKGPPIIQPFYDFFKLIDKRPMIVHSLHAWLGVLHFLGMWLAVAAEEFFRALVTNMRISAHITL